MNELNYATFESSKRLMDAGIMLKPYAYFFCDQSGEWKLIVGLPGIKSFVADGLAIPAPSMAEVWRELPDFIDIETQRYRKTLYRDGGLSVCWFFGLQESRFQSRNPTDALIDLLIWVQKEIDLLIWVKKEEKDEA